MDTGGGEEEVKPSVVRSSPVVVVEGLAGRGWYGGYGGMGWSRLV